MQAVILAAGMGKRLGKYTRDVTKCMVKVNGKTLIERALDSLVGKVDRVVLVIGYKGEKLKDFLGNSYKGTPIHYIENPLFETTNNIYSLWLASDEMKKDDTILLESDVIFEESVIDDLLSFEADAVAVVHKFEDWMDGTVVLIDEERNVKAFIDNLSQDWDGSHNYYKTVNIYKFSKEFFTSNYFPFLRAYVESNGYSSYYEVVLSIIVGMRNIKIKALIIDGKKWYEIDTPEDLWSASVVFSDAERRYELLKENYGGYWRFPNLKDFCYLVNPYFPDERFVSRMKKNFSTLLRSYPSGRERIKELVSEVFGVDQRYVLPGNGASELIKAISDVVETSVGVILPTFEEYPQRFKRVVMKKAPYPFFRYSEDFVMNMFSEVDNVVLINPDNPTGNFIEKDGVLKVLDGIKGTEKRLFVDESFVDFADADKRFSLLSDDILERYPNLIVIRSMGKSHGIPGIRLGIMATSDERFLKDVEKRLPIWNVGSFAEYFLQKMGSHKEDYKRSCDLIARERVRLIDELSRIEGIEPIPSQANFLLCRVENSTDLAVRLIGKDIFIKDCYGKLGIDKPEYIRLSVRSMEENDYLINSIKEVLRSRYEA